MTIVQTQVRIKEENGLYRLVNATTGQPLPLPPHERKELALAVASARPEWTLIRRPRHTEEEAA
jgi:hypothetical protein